VKLFSLKDYAESKTSAPEFIGDISSEYGKKQIYKMAEFNGLVTGLGESATVVPFGMDYETTVALQHIQETIFSYGGGCYVTECGEVYAIKDNLDYSYLDNSVDEDGLWGEFYNYEEENSA